MNWKYLEGVKARHEAFELEHSDPIMDDSNSWILYSDGAYREVNPMGRMSDGPRDPFERQKRIVHYHELVLRRVTEEFHRFRRNLGGHANSILTTGMGHIRDEAIEQLKKLQETVRQKQKTLEAAKADLDATMPEDTRRAKAADASNRERTQHQLEEIKSIKV